MTYRYTVLVDSYTVFSTNVYTVALKVYSSRCKPGVVVVQLIDNTDSSTVAEYRP